MAEDMAFFVATGDADGMSKTVLQLGQRIRLPKTPSATRSRAWHEPHSTRMAILGNPMSIGDCMAILAQEMPIGYVFLFEDLKAAGWKRGTSPRLSGGALAPEPAEITNQATIRDTEQGYDVKLSSLQSVAAVLCLKLELTEQVS